VASAVTFGATPVGLPCHQRTSTGQLLHVSNQRELRHQQPRHLRRRSHVSALMKPTAGSLLAPSSVNKLPVSLEEMPQQLSGQLAATSYRTRRSQWRACASTKRPLRGHGALAARF